jgi:hypothetical protein
VPPIGFCRNAPPVPAFVEYISNRNGKGRRFFPARDAILSWYLEDARQARVRGLKPRETKRSAGKGETMDEATAARCRR